MRENLYGFAHGFMTLQFFYRQSAISSTGPNSWFILVFDDAREQAITRKVPGGIISVAILLEPH